MSSELGALRSVPTGTAPAPPGTPVVASVPARFRSSHSRPAGTPAGIRGHTAFPGARASGPWPVPSTRHVPLCCTGAPQTHPLQTAPSLRLLASGPQALYPRPPSPVPLAPKPRVPRSPQRCCVGCSALSELPGEPEGSPTRGPHRAEAARPVLSGAAWDTCVPGPSSLSPRCCSCPWLQAEGPSCRAP